MDLKSHDAAMLLPCCLSRGFARCRHTFPTVNNLSDRHVHYATRIQSSIYYCFTPVHGIDSTAIPYGVGVNQYVLPVSSQSWYCFSAIHDITIPYRVESPIYYRSYQVTGSATIPTSRFKSEYSTWSSGTATFKFGSLWNKQATWRY